MTAPPTVGLIGRPVGRSMSPVLHAAAFSALKLPWRSVVLSVRSGKDGLSLMRALGLRGANVTIPHKVDIAGRCDRLDGGAAAIGAVNTVVVGEDGETVGHNTDADGFVAFLTGDAGFDPAGRQATVLGAGGAARAVAAALARAGATVAVCARRPAAARAVAALHPGIATQPWGVPDGTDLLVNATPVREGLPVPDAALVVDLIYQGSETELLARARAAGARAFDGLGMLVHQAALSVALWTGRLPPIGPMRAAVGTRSRR